jgi:ATP-dependent helicase/nuclease subunit B
MVQLIVSTSAAARLDAARTFVVERSSPARGARPPAELVIAGASRGAADDFARTIARGAGATFGLTRFSFMELAARAAAARVAARSVAPGAIDTRRVPGTQAGAEAMAARAVFDAAAAGQLEYFAPVAGMPGFPRALARTLHELRLAGFSANRLSAGLAGRDLSRLLERVEDQLARAAVDDRAALFRAAADAVRLDLVRWARLPLVLLDVPLDSRMEGELLAALLNRSSEVLATVPDGDDFALAQFSTLNAQVSSLPEPERSELTVETSDLSCLRRFIFTSERPDARERAGDVALFSAPGEGREAVEIVRRLLDEAERGVPFDEMAVFLRTPQQYLGLLEHACARGDVPVYFDRGTRRPDPAGRAFIALLSCGVEGLSAKRFDEYLSLGQVPPVGARREQPAVILPEDEVFAELGERMDGSPDDDSADPSAPAPVEIDSDDEAVIAGTLRSPWKWEELIVESAVVGGRTRADGSARWRRRLDGLAADFRYRIRELQQEEPESARIARYQRDLRNLVHLRQFALPIVDELASWPERATWGEWLERFDALATRALRRPERVRKTLADLRPMADVGPVTLEEARDVLHDRLVTLDWEPPARRYGRVFVGTPLQARGRAFRVVFVPGLAERVVPQRPREDPLLLDEIRRALDDDSLVTQVQRGAAERLLLKIAIGAATERLYLSYPRLDVAETRARVPSFYALDVMRAITGRVPDHRLLASEAAEAGGASLAWPAPRDADRAIDDLEHDLASLKPLLDSREPASVRGHAHYLLGLNEALRRSVISRWARGRSAWSPSDGLVRVAPGTAAAIAKHRLARRAYSLSALQRFATCPYQFLLATIYRLEPWDEPEPLVRMDPLTRGSLYHRVQAEFYRAMQARGDLPVTPDRVAAASEVLDDVLDRVAAEYAETLAPAIDRVWNDEVSELRRDLGIWVQRLADGGAWQPAYFEFSFGLGAGGPREQSDSSSATARASGGGPPRAFELAEGRDPRSLPDPILVDDRFVLHGSVDLIEHDPQLDILRVTDHKTGKNRSNPDLIVGGGAVLQPVLYSVAVEKGLGKRVVKGRLFYSTTAGGFVEHEIPINDYTRGQGLQVLSIIDRSVELGFLPAAPDERACTWCDFRPVCGPREKERVERKAKERLADLEALRSMR